MMKYSFKKTKQFKGESQLVVLWKPFVAEKIFKNAYLFYLISHSLHSCVKCSMMEAALIENYIQLNNFVRNCGNN